MLREVEDKNSLLELALREFVNDDVEEDDAEAECLHVLMNMPLREAVLQEGRDDGSAQLQCTAISWSPTGSTIAVAYGRHDVQPGAVHQDHTCQGEERASSTGPKGLPEPHPAVPRQRGSKVGLRCVQQYAAPIDSPSVPPWVH